MKHMNMDLKKRVDNGELVEVWACAYSTNNTEKSMGFKCPPTRGVISKSYNYYFTPYNKSGEPVKSKEVKIGSRHYFDNEQECKEFYNSLIQEQVDKLETLLSKCKEDFVVDDFDTWLLHGVKEDYSWIIGEDEAPKTREFIDENMWVERYMTLTLDSILEMVEERLEDGEMTEEEAEEIKQELMAMNFGSCEWDW